MSDYYLWKEGFWQPSLCNATVFPHDVGAKRNYKTKVIKFCCNLPHWRWRERTALSGAARRRWRSFRGHLTSAQYLKCKHIQRHHQCCTTTMWCQPHVIHFIFKSNSRTYNFSKRVCISALHHQLNASVTWIQYIHRLLPCSCFTCHCSAIHYNISLLIRLKAFYSCLVYFFPSK